MQKNTATFKILNSLQQDLLERLLGRRIQKKDGLMRGYQQQQFQTFCFASLASQETIKKSKQGFDDCHIVNIRKCDSMLQSSEITTQKQYLPRCKNSLIVPIEEESMSSPLKLNWNNWDSHVHYVPQDLIQIINQNNNKLKDLGNSNELSNEQQKQDEVRDCKLDY